MVEHERLFKQSISGVLPTFCSDLAGTTYRPTESVLWLRLRSGVDASVEVWVRVQTRSWVERRGPTATPLPWASSAAFELMKYSVPPAEVLNIPAGATAGHSVNPELPLSIPWVSICVTPTVPACRTSAAFENA